MIPPKEADPGLERLGDEIAELSVHLDAATARLLDLIRDFDARLGRLALATAVCLPLKTSALTGRTVPDGRV